MKWGGIRWIRGFFVRRTNRLTFRTKSLFKRYAKELHQASYDLTRVKIAADSPVSIGGISSLLARIADTLDELTGERR